MNCPIDNDNPELLVAYSAGELDPETTAAITNHMASCLECRTLVEAQSAVWNALDAWEAPPVSADFDRRLYQRIQAEAPGSWWDRLMGAILPVPFRKLVPLAAAACLMLTVGLILQPPPRVRATVPAGPTVRAEQVENTLDDLELLRQSVGTTDVEVVHSDAM